MPISVEKLSEEPIIIVKISGPVDLARDVPALSNKARSVLDATNEPIWNITLMEDLHLSFGEVVMALGMSTRGELNFLRHPKVREYMIIADDGVVQLASRALSQAQYGGLRVTMCGSLEEALRKVRECIKGQERTA